jgi:hypothetical protein
MSLPPRFRCGLLAVSLVALLATGCAVNHSDNFVSLVMTKEVAASIATIAQMDVRVESGLFGSTTTKGKNAPGLEMIANRQLGTLLPALRRQLPAVFRRNGIASQTLPGNGVAAAGHVMTVKPLMAGDDQGGTVGLTVAIEIRDRAGALVWRGTALERAGPSRPEMTAWSDDMAEDLARTLLIRLRREGLVKLGANGDADPI